jgi:class 3 adenylate cyclase
MANVLVIKSTWLQFISITARLLSGVMVGIIIVFLLPLVLPYVEDATHYSYIRSAIIIERSITAAVKSGVPTRIAGTDISRWLTILLAVIGSSWLGGVSRRAQDRAEFYGFKQNIDEWKKKFKLSDTAVANSPLAKKLEQLKSARKKDREHLLKEFAEIKKKLDETGRDLAFLSIDVVDSAGMKEGEERAIVEHDFREYKRFIETTLTSHGCLKSTWTPDGVMSAFNTVDNAVRASREIIKGLDNFNRNIKSMRRDFAVRCGVNSGYVYFDEAIPLEEISDRIIDIAGHMQKNARPNTVCVGKPAIEPLDERNGFEPSGKTVDGYEVYEWKKA